MVPEQAERHYRARPETLSRGETRHPGGSDSWSPGCARKNSPRICARPTPSWNTERASAGTGRLDCAQTRLSIWLIFCPLHPRRGRRVRPRHPHDSAATVDAAICHHALEHIMQPAAALEEMGGCCAGRETASLRAFERERKYRRFDPDEPHHHVYSWNVQTLGNLVQECGFRVAAAGTGRFGYDRFAAVWAAKLRLGEPGFRALRRLLLVLKPARECGWWRRAHDSSCFAYSSHPCDDKSDLPILYGVCTVRKWLMARTLQRTAKNSHFPLTIPLMC